MPTSGIGTPYWYEWEIGIIECLNMMMNPSIQSVTLQSENFQSLDDVVIKHSDGCLTNIQVKHTAEKSSMTYSFLDNSQKPLLQGWAKEWQEKKQDYTIGQIRIVTNKPWGQNSRDGKCSFAEFVTSVFPKLKENYSYSSDCSDSITKSRADKAIAWYKKQLECIGEDAAEFTTLLDFCQTPDLPQVNQQIRDLVIRVIGTDKTEAVDFCIKGLLSAAETWATSKRLRQEIIREDVYRIFCAGSPEPPRYELYPVRPIFPSRVSFAESFVAEIQNCPEKVIFLEGLPGAGKTNFVSYLAQMANSIVDFRYYTYLPVNAQYPSFSDDEGFYTGKLLWLSLLNQMKRKFEELGKLAEIGFPLAYSFLSVSELRMHALQFLPIYAGFVERTCYFFIDGIDHAARSTDARNSFLHQLPQPEELGENVKFILVGQPINDKYPNWLTNKKNVLSIKLPVLNYQDVAMLLHRNEIHIPGTDEKVLAETIIGIVGENALNVLFAIQEAHKIKTPISFDEIVEFLQARQLNNHISRYYEWLISSISQQSLLKKIESVFACVSQKVPLKNLSLLCDTKEDEIAFLLNQLSPMISQDEWGYYTFHNDVRLYLKDLITGDSMLSLLINDFRKQIETQEELGQYSYDLLFELLLIEGNLDNIMSLFSPAYIVKSVQYHISATKLIRQFIMVARKIQNTKAGYYLKKLSPAAILISQLTECIQYFQRESSYFESKMPDALMESEKYILDREQKLGKIITDIYSLLERAQIERAKALYNEYLSDYVLSDYLTSTQDRTYILHEQSGYICRYFNPRILTEQSFDQNESYLRFVSGWLSAGARMLSEESIQDTLSFEICCKEDLLIFVKKVVEGGRADFHLCATITEFLLATESPVSAVIELTTFMKQNNWAISAGIEYIKKHLCELVQDTAVEYASERIPFCIKALFCLYPEEECSCIEETYEAILSINRINPTKRGYPPAQEQMNIAKAVCALYHGERPKSVNLDKNLVSMAYLEYKFGTGSCHDCAAHSVKRFLRQIILLAFESNRMTEADHNKVCDTLHYLMTNENPRYLFELLPLFKYDGDKDKLLQIADFWFGVKGNIWSSEYENIEYCFKFICNQLTYYGELQLINLIQAKIQLKMFGYSGHKDYSLTGMLECYRRLPLTARKLMKNGMELLAISDKAGEIGDNRLSSEIDHELFDNAARLGPPLLDALFELKNYPKELVYWRDCVLLSLSTCIKDGQYCDDDLEALFCLVNSWINVHIEENRQYNRIANLKEMNALIVEKISNSNLKERVKSSAPCELREESNYTVHNSQFNYEYVVSEYTKSGYSDSFTDLVKTAFSDRKGGNHNIFLELRKVMDETYLQDFCMKCVVPFVVQNCNYTLRNSGAFEVLQNYDPFFAENDWWQVYSSIVDLSDCRHEESFRYVAENLETLTIEYCYHASPDSMEDLFNEMVAANRTVITACGSIHFPGYALTVDPHIQSMTDFVNKQVGTDYRWNSV